MALREPLKNTPAQNEIIEKMVKRYSITYVPNRGVSLFDIVGFSLLSPFEQMMQLNSLSYSLNSAQSKLLTKRIGVDFSRTTTGDGFYIWNRDLTLEGNVNLYHFMQLVLADNAIAHKKAQHNTVPRLASLLPRRQQLRVSPSRRPEPDALQLHRRRRDGRARAHDRARAAGANSRRRLPRRRCRRPTRRAASRASDRLRGFRRAWRRARRAARGHRAFGRARRRDSLLSDRARSSRTASSRCGASPINDKHGISRRVYNAKVNIYRHNAEPILLGIEDRVLDPRRAWPRQRAGAAAGARLTRQCPASASRSETAASARAVVSEALSSSGIACGKASRTRQLRLRAREAQLVVAHGDEVAVAKPMLAHAAAVHEATVGAAEVDQHPAFGRLHEQVLVTAHVAAVEADVAAVVAAQAPCAGGSTRSRPPLAGRSKRSSRAASS